MNKIKKMSKYTVLIAIIIIILFGLGYRFTGLQAAKNHYGVGKDAELLGQVKYDWGNVYLFKTDKGPQTIISKRFGLLWRAKVGFHMNNSNDAISVVGWGNDINCTVYAVQVTDNNVKYIEIGPEDNRIRKYVDKGNLIIFSWDKSIPWNDFNGKAYSTNGEVIYELRYPRLTSALSQTWLGLGTS